MLACTNDQHDTLAWSFINIIHYSIGQCNLLVWMNDHIISFDGYLINIIRAYTLTRLLDWHNTLAWLLDQYNAFAWVDNQHNTLAWLHDQSNPFT